MRLALTKPGLKLISAAITGDDTKAALATPSLGQRPIAQGRTDPVERRQRQTAARARPRSTAWPSLRPARLRSSRLQRPGNWATLTLPPATPCAAFVGRIIVSCSQALPRATGAWPSAAAFGQAGHMKGDIANGRKSSSDRRAPAPPAIRSTARESTLGPSWYRHKLGKEALYLSILEPSAGISFGYEAWLLKLKNGGEALGVITSSDAEVTLECREAFRPPQDGRHRAAQLPTSIMPPACRPR